MEFFTSDWHLGHARISELANRPFLSVVEMNRSIIDKHNWLVGRRDTIYVLGDAVMGPFRETLELVREMKGNKILVPGNHDRVFGGPDGPNKKRYHEFLKMYQDVGFTVLDGDVSVTIPDATPQGQPVNVRLNHFPYGNDSQDSDRYAEYRPTFDEERPWLLHGHVHEKWETNGYQINVGVDVWDFYPVPIHRVADLIRNKEVS